MESETFGGQICKFFRHINNDDSHLGNSSSNVTHNYPNATQVKCQPKNGVLFLLNSEQCEVNFGSHQNYYPIPKKEDIEVITIDDSDESDSGSQKVANSRRNNSASIEIRDVRITNAKHSNRGSSLNKADSESRNFEQAQKIKLEGRSNLGITTSSSAGNTSEIFTNQTRESDTSKQSSFYTNSATKKKRNVTARTVDKSYSCKFCNQVYSPKYLSTHVDFHCQLKKNYYMRCNICGVTIAGRVSVSKHMRMFHNINQYDRIDSVCTKIAADSCKSRSNRRKFVCNHCGQSTANKRSLTIHTRYRCKILHSHAESKEHFYCCSYCDKEFLEKKDLDDHILTKHQNQISADLPEKTNLKNQLRYTCNLCKTSFEHDDSIQQKRICENCQKTNDRISENMLNQYICNLCGKTFPKNRNLCHHKLYCNIFLFCRHCGKRYSKYNDYISHTLKCFENVNNRNLSAVSNTTSPKEGMNKKFRCFYMCGICLKSNFKSPCYLQNHLKEHSEVNIICNSCKINFDYYDDFKNHLKRDRSNKPYKCAFAKSDNRKTIKTTAVSDIPSTIESLGKENPYQCDVCSKCFSEVSSLVNHIKEHLKCEGNI